MREYASLQLKMDEGVEAARERIIYAITAHMDACGYIPCGRDSAERTVLFARIEGGWAVYDDCSDRLDLRALNGLARCLTSGLHTCAVGVVGMRDGYLLRLYSDGILRDTFSTLPKSISFPAGRLAFPGHAIRWRSALKKDCGIRELSIAFSHARQHPEKGFLEICRLLSIDDSACFGFSSVEDSRLEGVITMYFHAANHIRQRWIDRILHVPARCSGTATSTFSQRKGCRQRR